MQKMTAIRAYHRGGPETLVFEDAPRPVPAADEVLVDVHAAAITFTELTWDETWRNASGADRAPIIPSHELSGVVAEVGSMVTDIAVGDEVYGLIDFNRDGAAAEQVAMPASALAAKPRTVSHVEAATLPLAALTAWQALVDHAHVGAGDTVLIQGGAGGVGVYAVQLAADLGAQVIATGSAGQEEFVRGLGADTFIDYRSAAFDDQISDVDVVVDAVGGDTMERSFGILKPGGRLVTLVAPPPAHLAAAHRVDATFFVVSPDRTELTSLADLVDRGELRPVVSATFPLADGRAAFESASRARKPGKTVLVVREG